MLLNERAHMCKPFFYCKTHEYSRNYSKTSLNRPTTGPTLNGPFREVVSLEYCYNGILWEISLGPNKVIDIGEWLICGGGRLEKFYCTYSQTLSITVTCQLLHGKCLCTTYIL